jgi:hypothetical protein
MAGLWIGLVAGILPGLVTGVPAGVFAGASSAHLIPEMELRLLYVLLLCIVARNLRVNPLSGPACTWKRAGTEGLLRSGAVFISPINS